MGKMQTVDFSEAIVASDIEVDICNHLFFFFLAQLRYFDRSLSVRPSVRRQLLL